MSADGLLYQVLINDAPLTALVGTDIYFGRVPNNFEYPVLQMDWVGENPITVLEGNTELRNPIYQMDVYARTREEATQVEQAVRAALIGTRAGFTANYTNGPFFNDFEEDSKDNRLTAQLSVWYGG